MTTIGSIGIGLFILIILWILALILFVVSVRLQSNLGWIGLGVVLSVTLIVSLIPLETPNKIIDASIPEEKDYQLIYKYILLIFLIFSFFSLLIIFFFTYFLEPIRPKPLNT